MALDATGRPHIDALIPHATAAADPEIPNADRFGIGALGRVEPASAARRVGPPGTLTMNRVDRLLVHEGDDVPAGQLLAEFADAPIKDAAVQQAEATVAEAQAELARVNAGGRPSDIKAQEDQIASLTAQEDIARRDAERARILVPTGAGARAVAERAEAAADRAVALRREAEAAPGRSGRGLLAHMKQALEIRDLSYAYGTGAVRRPVLKDITLTAAPGEIVLLTGPSGSGKTTLMALIGALRAVQTGSCVVLGRALSGAGERKRIAIRRQVGFVFQDHRLLGFLTAAQNVAISLEVDAAGTERDRMRRATAMLESVGLAAYADTRPDQLSGGQRQRVAIARALVRNPGLILADEPTAALDRQSGAEITQILCELGRHRGATVLIVTHDVRILGIADRVLTLEDGRIRPDLPPANIPPRVAVDDRAI